MEIYSNQALFMSQNNYPSHVSEFIIKRQLDKPQQDTTIELGESIKIYITVPHLGEKCMEL